MDNLSQIECNKCKRKICSSNIKLHQLQCQGNSNQVTLTSISFNFKIIFIENNIIFFETLLIKNNYRKYRTRK